MILLIRILLIGTVIYLIFKQFADAAGSTDKKEPPRNSPDSKNKTKKISKEIGEYVDYEDINK